ncbi:TPA: YheV family putative metal-binding protein [Morganella morganii]|nr:YheV family putative metal-binding protein [Morganella morganii]
MSNRKRFIAAAVCPECQTQDTLAMWREDNVDVVQCVQCGHLERRADAPAEQHIRKDEQIIGIFTPGE